MIGSVDEYMTPGGVVAALERGCKLSTDVYDPEKTKAAGPVYLHPGDEVCSECGSVIADEFGPAPYAKVLANMKLKHGETYCVECHR